MREKMRERDKIEVSVGGELRGSWVDFGGFWWFFGGFLVDLGGSWWILVDLGWILGGSWVDLGYLWLSVGKLCVLVMYR